MFKKIKVEKRNRQKNSKRCRWLWQLLVIGIFLLPSTVWAEDVQLTIEANREEVQVGEEITFVVTFESGREIGTIHGELSYDDALMEYSFGGGNTAHLQEGEGSISHSLAEGRNHQRYEFTFIANAPGEAEFSVDFSEVISHGQGAFLGDPENSIGITIQEEEGEMDPGEEDHREESEEEGEGDASKKGIGLHKGKVFSILPVYQAINRYEMKLDTMNGVNYIGYRSNDLPDQVILVYGHFNDRSPGLYFYDGKENTFQRAEVEEEIIEKEVEQQRNLLPGPIIFLIATALVFTVIIVIVDQLPVKEKANNQQGESS